MPPIDPLQLLKALSPLLSPEGGIKSVDEVSRLSSLMKKFSKKLVSRCVYINVLRASPVERIDEFLKKGGWETIHMWLHESKKSSNFPFLIGLLQLYKLLPMTVERLKENNSAKLIKGLTKSENEDVKMLSSQVVDSWVKLVKGDQGDAIVEATSKPEKDGKDIKKKKRKEKDDKKEEKKDEKKDASKKDKSSSKDSKEKSKESRVLAAKKSPEKRDPKDRARLGKEAEKEAAKDKRLGKEPIRPIKVAKVNNKIVVRSDELEDVKLPDYIRLPEASDKVVKPERKSTVKQYQARFRSTGLEEPTSLPGKAGSGAAGAAKKKLVPPLIISKLPIKRYGDSIKKDLLPPIKKLKSPNLTLPKPDTLDKLATVTKPTPEVDRVPAIPSAVTPVAHRHEVERREIKLIAPRPAAHVIQESAGFMDALVAPPTNPIRKKRKLLAGSGKNPTTPPSPTISAPKLQFYKDTLESQDESSERKESVDGEDSFAEAGSSRDPSDVAQDDEDGERPSKRSLSPESKDEETNSCASAAASEATSQSSSSAATQPGKRARTKKKVSWAAEATLKQIYYFELDETERVNVNNIKNFGDMKTLERQKERQVVENARRMAGDEMEERINWLPLIPIDLPPTLIEPGCNSLEREIQRAREEVVLQEIFFSKESLPDTPHEPDPEVFEPEEPKIIPLEDENNPDAVVDYSMLEPPAPVTCLPPALSNLVMSLSGVNKPTGLSGIGQNVLNKAFEMAMDMNVMNNDAGPMQNFNHQGMDMSGLNMGIPPPGFHPMNDGFHHHNNEYVGGHPPPMEFGIPPPPHGVFPPPPPPMGMDGPPRNFFDDSHGMMNPHMRPPMMGGPRRQQQQQQQRGRPMMRHPGPMRGGNGGGGGGRGGRGRGNMMMGPNSRGGGGPGFRGDGPNFRGDGPSFRGDGPNFRGRGRDQRGGFGERGGGGRGRVVCRHFLNGHCKYEGNCNNIHPHPNKNGPHS